MSCLIWTLGPEKKMHGLWSVCSQCPHTYLIMLLLCIFCPYNVFCPRGEANHRHDSRNEHRRFTVNTSLSLLHIVCDTLCLV